MLSAFIDWLAANRLEAGATALGLVNQWLTIRQNIWCWPIGIVSVVLFGAVFFEAKLYSDVLLQGCYVGLQAYGWHRWMYGGPSRALLRIHTLTTSDYWRVPLLAAIGAVALGTLMRAYTDASLPYLDATATALSLVAQWLQARKMLESWLVFIAANLLFIGIYAIKGLYTTIALFVVLTALAAAGFVAWRRSYRAGLAAPPSRAR